jgi:hypothetical protein
MFLNNVLNKGWGKPQDLCYGALSLECYPGSGD